MAVLSIAKLRPGAEAYQLSGVAEGLDAYCTGAGEAPGRWVGAGAAALGFDGEADGRRYGRSWPASHLIVVVKPQRDPPDPQRPPGAEVRFEVQGIEVGVGAVRRVGRFEVAGRHHRRRR